MKRHLISLFIGILISLIIPKYALAHPADEIGIKIYDQKQLLSVSPKNINLQIDLTFYALEKAKLWSSINNDLDQSLSLNEKEDWMNKGSDSSWLTVNGKKHKFKPVSVSIPDFDEFFSKKPVNIKITFVSNLTLRPGDSVTYFYVGKDQKLENINFEVKGVDGLNITDLSSPSSETKSFKIVEGNTDGSQISGIKSSGRLNHFLDTYVKVDKISPGLIVLALAAAFLIGMLHALTPGHGKAILAGFLVGEKGTVWNAVQMGLIITITHTSSVFLLGIGIMLLAQYIVPSTVISRIYLISGLMVCGFGIYLLITRIKKLYIKNSHSHLTHSHSHIGAHTHHHDHTEIELSWKNLLPLGISGGIVPCVDALAILIVAVSLNKIGTGIVLLIFFSLGLATALILGGVIVVVAKRSLYKKISALNNYEEYISIASALIVTVLGIAIVFGKQL